MSGVKVINALLCANFELTSLIPASRIMAGGIAVKTAYPAIGIKSVVTTEEKNVAMNSTSYLSSELVQVTVYAKSYVSQKNLTAMIRKIICHSRGYIGGVFCDRILHENDGPDINDNVAQLFEQSQDFMVSYHR